MNNLTLNSTALNILRVYATALVFFCHSTLIAKECFGLQLHGSERFINTPAWGGVWMFLTIGGLLAAHGFDQHKYTLDKCGILKYYKGRIVKVLIPTYIFLSLMYVFNMQESHISWITILEWLTCTFNGGGAGIKFVGASWYVFIIMWLYLVAPCVIKVMYKYEKKHEGKEFKSYIRFLLVLCLWGIIFRVIGSFLGHYIDHSIYYNWFYANVTGTFDLFLLGVIGKRMMSYLPVISDERIILIRRYAVFALLVTTLFFLGNVKYQSTIYHVLGPCLFSLSTIAVIIAFSYTSSYMKDLLTLRFFNLIAPYTFMFYLWHSPLLAYVAEKIVIYNNHIHFISMLIIGGLVTAYISFLMTKMNNGIIKSILKK